MLVKSNLVQTNHGFFGREGGVSVGDFASLNCGLGSGDNLEKVRHNRQIICTQLGAKTLVTSKQTHSNITNIIEAEGQYEGDALVTKSRGIALGVLTADCVPILLYDAGAQVIGAAHAGWRGALGGIIESVMAAMQSLGAKNIVAAIGPCIQQKSFEVRDDARDLFVREASNNARYFLPTQNAGQYNFDLVSYEVAKLKKAGAVKVDVIAEDTYSQPEKYFSFRRNTHEQKPQYGRQVSAIVL